MYRFSARAQQLPTNIVASCPSFPEVQVLKDGTCVEHLVPANKPLPVADTLKIKNVVEAGLPLERVNSKVLQPDFGHFSSPDLLESFENEVIDEQG